MNKVKENKNSDLKMNMVKENKKLLPKDEYDKGT